MKTMKVVACLAVTVIAISAQAVGINWGTSGNSFGNAYANDLVILLRGPANGAAPTATGGSPTMGISGGVFTTTGFDVLGALLLSGTGAFNGGNYVTINQTEASNWNAANHMTQYVPAGQQMGVGSYAGLPTAPNNTTILSTGTGAAGKRDYYMIVFNASQVSSATGYKMVETSNVGPSIGGSSWLMTTDPNMIAGDWQAIPEPATLALMGIGAGLVALRRRHLNG